MSKELTIKRRAIEYGFNMDFINSIKVRFTTHGYGYDSKLGKYLPLRKVIILYDTDIDSILPTYYHELTHALQNIELERRYGSILGIILYWMALTFLRTKIEKDAREIEDRMYNQYMHEYSKPLYPRI